MGFSSPNSSPNKPLPLPLPSHTTIEFSTFFLSHQVQVVLHKYLWEWGQAWYVVDLPGVTSLEKTDSLSPSSYQMPVAPQLVLGVCGHLPLQCWASVWREFVQVLCVLTQPLWLLICNYPVCHVGKTLFPWCYPPPQALTISLSPLLRISLSVGCEEFDAYVPFRAEYSSFLLLSIWTSWESPLFAIYYKEKPLRWGLRDVLIMLIAIRHQKSF